MAKRIIVLEQHQGRQYSVCFWASVPEARRIFHANAEATSAYKQATAEEVGAIRDGSVVERVDTISVPQGASLAQMAAILESYWTDFQAAVTNETTFTRYGTAWDGTTWTQAGA